MPCTPLSASIARSAAQSRGTGAMNTDWMPILPHAQPARRVCRASKPHAQPARRVCRASKPHAQPARCTCHPSKPHAQPAHRTCHPSKPRARVDTRPPSTSSRAPVDRVTHLRVPFQIQNKPIAYHTHPLSTHPLTNIELFNISRTSCPTVFPDTPRLARWTQGA